MGLERNALGVACRIEHEIRLRGEGVRIIFEECFYEASAKFNDGCGVTFSTGTGLLARLEAAIMISFTLESLRTGF
jgi:hypothetical protein